MDDTLERLEDQIAKYVGTRFAVACSSARTAIRFSLMALKIGRGNEVVIPDFACQILPITAFCVGAVPVFCDIDRETCALSPEALPRVLSSNTKAIIFVHLFGLPVDPTPIIEMTRERGIAFIDDGAQALGSSIDHRMVGSFGEIGILTFNKFLDVDLGGAVTTNDAELAKMIKLVRDNQERRWFSTAFGYKAVDLMRPKSRQGMRMIFERSNRINRFFSITLAKRHFREADEWVQVGTDIIQLWKSGTLSSVVIDQLMTYAGRYWHSRKMEREEILILQTELKEIERYLQDRREIARAYDEHIDEGDFDRINVQKNSVPSYLRYPILLRDNQRLAGCIRDIRRAGFSVDYRYKPLHMSPFFCRITKNSPFKESEYVYDHILPLPITRGFSLAQASKVADAVNLNLSR